MRALLIAVMLALSSALRAQSGGIPAGTVLPVKLTSTLDSRKSKPGDVITARIMQEVPLPADKIPARSRITGSILEISSTREGGVRMTLRFDSLAIRKQKLAITTDLRAMASMLEVQDAQLPTMGPGIGDVWAWMDTDQIGGDAVYGEGGPVMRGSEVVGTAVPGGVLVEVRANPAAGCRGAIEGNDSPQALWVFSSDACGPYGFSDLKIAHGGRTEPRGEIVLESSRSLLRVNAGAGLLLRLMAP